jgi:hypothetical protein
MQSLFAWHFVELFQKEQAEIVLPRSAVLVLERLVGGLDLFFCDAHGTQSCENPASFHRDRSKFLQRTRAP